ncbi:MAG: 5'-methylthioadenosine/S-adenosylhomocysteine nucleosidase [Dysosmobacter sp.]
MKIGLQFAMPAEFHALPGAKELEAFETVSGVPFYEAAPGIIACAGGVSKVNAAMAAEILCLKYGVDMIVNAGVAGCLTELPTGSLVVAEDFVQHDVDTSAIGDPVGLVSTVNRVSFPTWKPERCVELLAALGRKAALGRVATGDWFAVRSDRAIFIRDTFHPLLTEMEGGAIAQVCLREQCALRGGQICVRSSVPGGPDGGVFRFRPRYGGSGRSGTPTGAGFTEGDALSGANRAAPAT